MSLCVRSLLWPIFALSLLGACGKNNANEVGPVQPSVKVASDEEKSLNSKIYSVAFQRLGAETELVIPDAARSTYDITMCEEADKSNCVRLYRLICGSDSCQVLHGTTLEPRTNYYLLRRSLGDGKASIYIEDAIWVSFPLNVSFRAVALVDGVAGDPVEAKESSDIIEPAHH
ncbi:MAG: hypothetical protein JST16_02210 [Bdellovibrionales bacterium]|nr:hypothetical protein [Bdellovibrionales bacterium]